MTDEDITKIRERAEKATPAPWHVEGAALVVKHVPVEQGRINHIMTDAQYAGGCDRTPDAAFIAHAREDIPALLAEVERLQGRLHAVQGENTNLRDLNDAQLFAAAKTCKELREEVESLRAEITKAREAAYDEIQEFVVAHAFDTTVGRKIDDFITERLRALLASEG